MKELNTDYINPNPTSSTTLWYNGKDNAKNGTYEYKNNIKSNFIDKIANVRWNLGGHSTVLVSASNMYTYERGTTHHINPTDGLTRKDYWDGKVALIYPSDYGYASLDTTCRNNMFSLTNNVFYCKTNNWLFNSANQWTLSPHSGDARAVFFLNGDGALSSNNACNSNGVRPAVFLESDILIASGTGEKDSPYLLG